MNLFTAYVVSHTLSLKARFQEDRGASAVEYGLLVGLIAVAIIATVLLLGTQLNALFQRVTDTLAPVVAG